MRRKSVVRSRVARGRSIGTVAERMRPAREFRTPCTYNLIRCAVARRRTWSSPLRSSTIADTAETSESPPTESELVCLSFLQVEVAFEFPKHLIVDPSIMAKSQQRAPLHAKKLVRHRPDLVVLQWCVPRVLRRTGQGLQSLAIMLRQIVV